MSLRTAADAQALKRGTKCGVKTLRSTLSAAQLVELDELMWDEYLEATALARALAVEGWTIRGHGISGQTIRRHRRRECDCEPA